MLQDQEKIQYSRHILLEEISETGQEKLKKAKVLVIGAGGLGCPVLQYLTAAGIGTIGIIDHDTVDQTNLQRQILYTLDDLGKSKAEVAAKRLSRLNPFIFFEVYTEPLTNQNALELFDQYDIIVDGSDNFPTRYLVNDACVLSGKPLVFGSIFKFQGQVSVLNYNNGPTYRCLFPEPPSPGEVANCSEIGVLGVLPGIIGSLQANEALKLILGIGNILNGKLLCYDALSNQHQTLSFQKNESIIIENLEKDYDFFCGISSDNTVQEISALDLNRDLSNYQILDVRTEKEFEQFNIGGIHIPLQELSESIASLPDQKKIVVCCQSGIRSLNAIKMINEVRQDLSLYNLTGGLSSLS